jgi:hypothetical protein
VGINASFDCGYNERLQDFDVENFYMGGSFGLVINVF